MTEQPWEYHGVVVEVNEARAFWYGVAALFLLALALALLQGAGAWMTGGWA